MKKHRCIIVDDEPHAVELLKSYLGKFPDFELVATFTNSLNAIQFLNHNTVDLILLDIQMPELSGLEMLSTLSKVPNVIIVTAHRDYAVESFEFDILHYLLKPVPLDRFIAAINKYLDHNRKSQPPVKTVQTDKRGESGYFFVNINKKMVRIELNDILYIEGFGDYIKIYQADGVHLVHKTLGFMEKTLPNSDFIRIHKSYLISKSKIQGFTQTNVEIDGKTLPLGGLYKKRVLEQFNSNYRIL